MSLEEAIARRAARVKALRKLCEETFGFDSALTLEIGCGKGHYLSSYAAANPSELCVGIDLISERLRDAARRARNKNASNAHFLKAEALEFLDALPQGTRLEKIFIFFPDPWPKERHHKRRLINVDFLKNLRSFAVPDAKLYFRTDHAGYFEWAREALNESPHWEMLADNALPFEETSQFQRILPDFKTFAARAV